MDNDYKNIQQKFDWKFYVSYYSDLSHVQNKYTAWKHFKHHGYYEGRHYNEEKIVNEITKTNFDWNFYISHYKDLNHVTNKYVAWDHYKQYGSKEGRHANKESWEGNNKIIAQEKIMEIIEEPKRIEEPNPHILVIMPTYNRSNYLMKSIGYIKNQQYKNFHFLIIDDGSDLNHKEIFNKIKENFVNDKQLIFIENHTNIHIAKSLNKGIQYFLDNPTYKYLTWISDDNIYYSTFLSSLIEDNIYFKYTSYDIQELDGTSCTNNTFYKDFNNILNNFNGCASFMWTKEAIKQIGFYNETVPGCEDFEYLLRTFKINYAECKYFNNPTMKYIRHANSGFEIEKENILGIKQKIINSFNNKSISIVMAYYNRKPQTLETLRGFEGIYAGKYDFEVIIVDDNSNEENRLDEYINNFSFPIKLIVISEEEKGDRVNPCVPYNKGFKAAKGEIIIIQNPECYHVGDIISHTLNNLTEQDYFSYSCYGINTKELNDLIFNSNTVIYDDFIKDTNRALFYVKLWTRETETCTGNNPNLKTCDIEWINHPNKHPVGYHFCSSIYKSKLDLIGGFDERFKDGYCFDDDELLLSIKYNLQSNIQIIHPDNGFVVHQFHERNASFNIDMKDDNHPIKRKWLKNKILLEEMKSYHEDKQFNYPKLLHLYWDGSPLSFLNFITVLSFNEYHKFWKINVFLPEQKTNIITWKTHEQKIKYDGKCFLDKLNEINNVFIHKVNLDKIGFYNEASEVIKSDYFRYFILQKHGGVWSDFDIIYTGSVEDKMNFKEDTVIFRCYSYENPKNKKNYSAGYPYYPIGLFLCKSNNIFFKNILNNCKENYDKNEYQSIGAVMWSKIFPNIEKMYKFDSNVKVCGENYYLPWAWNELEEFLEITDNKLPDNNIGIHWFNGANKSKNYSIQLDERLSNFKPKSYIDKFVNKYIKDIKDLKKISIVMAYYNRRKQLIQTFKTIHKSCYKNIEIIIVDDNSDINEKVVDFIDDIKGNINVKIINIDKNNKKWVNPAIAYNIGIKHATGDIIVLQNPEVLYVGDCLQYIVDNLKKNDWLTFNCYGSPDFHFNYEISKLTDTDIFNKVNDMEYNIGGNSVIVDNVGGWLNHYDKHFVAYHYCGAIYKSDLMNKMEGGFNPDFANYIGGDDDEFVKRLIYNNFNFKINKFSDNCCFVIHQYHSKPQYLKDKIAPSGIVIFNKTCEKFGFTKENNIHSAPFNETPKSKQIII